MATRPLAAFEEFRQALELTTAQRNTISSRRDTIRRYIAADWVIATAIFGGSYARETKIRPRGDSRSDVDIFFVLDPGYRQYYAGRPYSKDPEELLDDIKRTLDKSLTTPAVRRDAPAVRITYRDLIIDVVPAFRRYDRHLDIPMRTRWLRATPESQARVFTALNAIRGGQLKPLIKMGKEWLRQHSSLNMRSYHLESLVYEHFSSNALADYRLGSLSMFTGLSWRVKYGVIDPGGSGSDVAAYMGTAARSRASSMFQNAAIAARAAIEDPTYEGEIRRWRSLYGSRFPAYG